MKILATSDMHGKLEGLEEHFNDVDVICFAGDIAPLNNLRKWDVYHQKKWVETKLFEMFNKHKDKKFVLVPGNHDLFAQAEERFGENDISWKIDWPKNAFMLIDLFVEIDGKRFYGTPWVPIISHLWAFEADSTKLKERFSHILSNLDVLIAHSPPHISHEINIDRSTQYGLTEAFGSYELSYELYLKAPKHLFCGHIHSGDHNRIQAYDTLCYNVSRVNEDYNIAYKPLIINI